jgi:heme exporter protein D
VRPKLALLLGIAAAALASTLLFFYFRDNFSTHYPVKVLSAAAWRSGEIPWWNFNAGGGQPLAGNPNTLSFYPDNVLYLLFPAHVAFNLHFILHLAAAWLAMRALTRSTWAAWLYVFSGAAISAMCFYNLIVALAMVPFALWASERGRWLPLGLAFGLMALAGEPVTIIAAALACLWSAAAMPPLFKAVPVAALIASPQLIAYAEVAREVERGAFRYSPRTVMAASFEPVRILELFVGPFWHTTLFPSLLVGAIALPALFRRSRYTVIAAVMFFFALGRYNPLVAFLVERIPALRIGRYPEKFALVGCIALVVLVAQYFRETRFKLLWTIATFVPLIAWAIVLLPVDRFAPYDVAPVPPRRVVMQSTPGGQTPNRAEYRERGRRLEPIFGAVAGLRYALDRSPDGMYSFRTRATAERYMLTRNPNYPAVVLGPRAWIVPRTIVGNFETIDVRTSASAPRAFVSPPSARVTAVREHPFEIDVTTPAPALLFVNETYFGAWVARAEGRELATMPIDVDRLGVFVPAGTHTVALTFGRHHVLVWVAWIVSLLTIAIAVAVEVVDRRAREVERAADEDRAAA